MKWRSMFHNEYRIVVENGYYSFQVLRWWFPIWTRPGGNCNTTVEEAERRARLHARPLSYAVKYLGPLR